MSQHYKVVCSVCHTVITQCRCPDPNKVVAFTVCEACDTKKARAAQEPTP